MIERELGYTFLGMRAGLRPIQQIHQLFIHYLEMDYTQVAILVLIGV